MRDSFKAQFGGALGLTAAVLIFSFGFSGGPGFKRNPSSASAGGSLSEWVRDLSASVSGNTLTEANCVSTMNRLTDEIHGMDPTTFPIADVEKDSEEAIRGIFAARTTLFNQARPILLKGMAMEACALGVHTAIRHLRGVEDYIGSIGYAAKVRERKEENSEASSSPSKIVSAQDHTRVAKVPESLPEIVYPAPGPVAPPYFMAPSMLMNPSLTETPGVRSGDILLSRGNAAASALIARMGDVNTQFSHVGFVYIDATTKEAWTIEAHIEYGSIVTPLKQWLSDGKARTIIFRYPDAAVAHRAAEAMFNRVAPLYRAGKSIHYDFAFDMNDHSKLFCSEVARQGFEIATGNQIEIPLFPSKIGSRSRDLMDRLGISQSASFVPADLEIDPRLHVVGEWRNFAKVPDIVQKDAVLTSIYTWLDRDKYMFDIPKTVDAKGYIALGLRKVGMLKDKLPTYMTQDVEALNMVIETMTNEFQARLAVLNSKRVERTGFPLSYYEQLAMLEDMRKSEGPVAKGPFRFLHP